jgi:hypothetical protein
MVSSPIWVLRRKTKGGIRMENPQQTVMRLLEHVRLYAKESATSLHLAMRLQENARQCYEEAQEIASISLSQDQKTRKLWRRYNQQNRIHCCSLRSVRKLKSRLVVRKLGGAFLRRNENPLKPGTNGESRYSRRILVSSRFRLPSEAPPASTDAR